MRRSGLLIMLIIALALPGVGTPLAASGRVTVTQVTVKVTEGSVQVRIEATGPVAYSTMTLADPDRVVVDLPGAVNGVAGGVLPVHQGPVQQIRVAQFTQVPPVVRVVVDLTRPAKYDVTMPSPAVVVVGFSSPAAAPASGVPSGAPVSAGPGIVVARRGVPGAGGPKLNLDLRDAALVDVLDALARLCGLNMVTDTTVGGRVTIHLVGVTCQEVLGFLLEANGLGYRRVGETLIVQAASKLAPPPPVAVTRVYKLQYLQPPLPPEALVGAGGAGGGGLSGGAGPVKKDVAALLDLFKATGAQVGYDDRTNALVVTGTPEQQEAVVALLRQLDVPLGQVVVEALVVDITSNRLRDLGVEWSVLQGTGSPIRIGETAAPPAQQFGIQPIARDALFALLHAFVSQGNAKVLSDPRVATYDGQEALIFAGDQIPIVNTTTAGNPPVTTSTVTFQPVGVTLKIIPKVNADRTVAVQVHPVVTTVTSFTAATSSNPNGLPIIAIREAVTNLQVRNGESIILGGLMRFSDIVNLKKVPFLGDLPFIGSLFQLTTVTHQESEVVIVMTPRILSMPVPAEPGQ